MHVYLKRHIGFSMNKDPAYTSIYILDAGNYLGLQIVA